MRGQGSRGGGKRLEGAGEAETMGWGWVFGKIENESER